MIKRLFLTLSIASTWQPGHAAESYLLDNGLEVVLEENHASPMIAAMVFVRAGSRFEQPQVNGVTHFLEHLLFNGTASRSQDQIEPVIEAHGGYINAFTRKEMTGYLVLLPREFIDTGLAIVSDMLYNSILPAEKIEKERGIVSEEIRKDTDNPDYQIEKAFDAFRYGASPYGRPVLGELNIIASVTRDEILEYYHAHYVPQNMSVLVLGDFNTADMKSSVDRYFGRGVAQAEPEEGSEPESFDVPAYGRQFGTHYQDIPVGRLLVSVPTFSPFAATFPALELWVDYLNQSGLSPFLARVTEGTDAVATRASVALDIRDDGADLRFDLVLKPGVDSQLALDAVLEGLAASTRDLPNQSQLAALVTSARADEYALLERLHYYGIMRAQRIGVLGWEHVSGRVDRMGDVSVRDLQEAVSIYRDCCAQYFALYVTLPPEVVATPYVSSDRFEYRMFPNGLTAIVKSNPDSRMFGAALLFSNRSASEPPGRSGMVDFSQRLLTYGAGTYSEGELSQRMAELGASITLTDNPYIPYDDFYTTPQFSFIKYSALDDHAQDALRLLHVMVTEPHFDSAHTEKVRGEILSALGMQSGSASNAARQALYDDLFAKGPLAASVMGDLASVGAIRSPDLKAFWPEYASPKNTVLAIATGADPEKAMAWIAETFGATATMAPPEPMPQPKAARPDSSRAHHVDMDKSQLVIDMGRGVCGPGHKDAAALRIATRILSDRLAANLREKQGLAYSVGAGISFAPGFGWITCRMGTAPENYPGALLGIQEEIERMKTDPPGTDELNKARNQMRGQILMRRLARENQCYYMTQGEFLGQGYDYDVKLASALQEVTSDDIKRVAELYLMSDRMILSTAGKRPTAEVLSER
jgi:zinc protease